MTCDHESPSCCPNKHQCATGSSRYEDQNHRHALGIPSDLGVARRIAREVWPVWLEPLSAGTRGVPAQKAGLAHRRRRAITAAGPSYARAPFGARLPRHPMGRYVGAHLRRGGAPLRHFRSEMVSSFCTCCATVHRREKPAGVNRRPRLSSSGCPTGRGIGSRRAQLGHGKGWMQRTFDL